MTIRLIKTSLGIAAGTLLQACASESTPAGPAAEANTTAPELIGRWESDCVSVPGTSSPTTTTSASGGTPSGSDTRRATITFEQDGHVEFINEYFASSNCNTNTRLPTSTLQSVYFVGGATMERNGSPTTELNYADGSNTVYSMFQVVGSTALYLGDEDNSTTGHDGSSEGTRFDGLSVRMDKQ